VYRLANDAVTSEAEAEASVGGNTENWKVLDEHTMACEWEKLIWRLRRTMGVEVEVVLLPSSDIALAAAFSTACASATACSASLILNSTMPTT
jgi:hypothetical protein